MIYDVIILGLGGVGSATAYYLKKFGVKNVLGFEQFHRGHDKGSSHGESRVIRKAYFEHPDYIPLLQHAYEEWANLEKKTSTHLYTQTGVLTIGPENGCVLPGVLQAAKEYQIKTQCFSPNKLSKTYSEYQLNPNHAGILEPHAGYLNVEQCVLNHLAIAEQNGAKLIFNTRVSNWEYNDGKFKVKTLKQTFLSHKLIITAGAWSHLILHDLNVDLKILHKTFLWTKVKHNSYSTQNGYGITLFEEDDQFVYHFPSDKNHNIKISEHSGGIAVNQPDDVKDINHKEIKRIQQFINKRLPYCLNTIEKTQNCFYTLSPDENFIIDHHPTNNHLLFCCGLSGHGFKMTNVLGECLASWAIDKNPNLPISFLSLQRFN